MLGRGNGQFDEPVVYDNGVNGEVTVVAGDFNRDGLVDVATGNRSIDVASTFGFQLWDSVSIFPGDGTGRLLPPSTYALANDREDQAEHQGTHHSLNTADLNNDRQTDLIASPGAILLNRVAPPNRAPTVWAGYDRIAESVGEWLLFGEATDPDRNWLTYTWTDEAGNVVARTPREVLQRQPGRYRFTLTVDDGHGGRVSDSVVIRVQDPSDFKNLGISSPPPSGATLNRGTPVTLRWFATDGAFRRFDLWVSANGGRSWGRISACTALPSTARECTWPSPSPVSDDARLRIVGYDQTGGEWISVTGRMRIQ